MKVTVDFTVARPNHVVVVIHGSDKSDGFYLYFHVYVSTEEIN
jgi:hypothetical protein